MLFIRGYYWCIIDADCWFIVEFGFWFVKTFAVCCIHGSMQDREMIAERQAALRQLETILTFHKLARNGKYSDALAELTKLSFLPLDSWKYDLGTDSLQNVQPSVKSCIPELLKVALSCLDNIPDIDGSVRRMRGKVSRQSF